MDSLGGVGHIRRPMTLLDLSHTAHTRSRTGVQRVSRQIFFALERRRAAQPVTFDRYRHGWRALEEWEKKNLNSSQLSKKRSAQWPALARWRGRWAAWTKSKSPLLTGDSLIVPEIFSPAVENAFPELFAQVKGPRIAIFHDAIALQFPELSPAKTVARFPAYLHALANFDGVAAVSKSSQAVLENFWRWAGVKKTPPVVALPLGLTSVVRHERPRDRANERINILCVSTIEGRKNHLALLEAAENLWSEGRSFDLRLIGMVQRETGVHALRKIEQLQRAGRPLRYDGPVNDDRLAEAYAECDFTVYPSLIEGFGLPVLESLQRGKPCLCSARGALGESAAAGGCLTVDQVDSPSLSKAMRTLIESTETRQRLADEASRRIFRNWDLYVDELLAWAMSLGR